ncbi:FtsK/SpoIIIE domain-containing protein [Rickettsiella grylli]|uniref:FtsK/SpoIIIE domain-containing protein n=1 Tax=Rickettsiella grylli TaxID=59196 RepID=UPI0000DAE48A|nr:FtsK/SpoIIIE domain-containing protein [Rickettsiella grylli]
MSSQAKESKSNLLDVVLEALTEKPRNLLVFFMLLGGLTFSVFSIVIGLLTFVVIRLLKLPIAWVVGLSIPLLLSSWMMRGVNLYTVYQQSRMLLNAYFYGNKISCSYLYVCLSALPYGLLLGGIFAFISQWNESLRDEVRRVARGKAKLSVKLFSEQKLASCLEHLKSSAYSLGTLLGVDQQTGHYVQLADKDANLHTLAIGTTGSGKTTGIANIIESAIVRCYPLFYVDGKGDLELAQRVQRFALDQGTPFYLFSMVGESLKYNPIAFGGFTSKKDRIVELRHWSEDHYRKIAEGYLQTVFKILAKTSMTLDLHSLAKHLSPESLYQLARQLGDASLVNNIEKLEEKKRDISSLIAEIENIADSEIGHLFDCSSGNVITLDKAFSERAVVYFCLQPLAFPAYAETLGKLIINDIKSLLASLLIQAEKIKLYTIFDEFSIFAGDQIVNLVNQGRGAGVHAVLSTQSLSVSCVKAMKRC